MQPIREKKLRGTPDFPLSIYHQRVKEVSVIYHWHPEIEFIYVVSGEFKVVINQKAYTANSGDFFFIGTEEFHALNKSIGDVEIYSAVFEPRLLDFEEKNPFQRQCIDLIGSGSLVFSHKITKTDECYDELKKQFLRLVSPSNAPFYQAHQIVALYEMLLCLMQNKKLRHKKKSPFVSERDENIKKVMAYVEENLQNKISLKDLAGICLMSEKYFCSFFKKQTNLTPIEYINRVRISKACDLLSLSTMNVTEISLECGFESLSYFIRQFKKITGVSPSEYKKSGKLINFQNWLDIEV